MDYELVIGMEIHVEIATASKVFCGCKNEFHAPANTHVCPVCLGLPGALPVMNREMINKSVAVGLALNCEISRWSKMDRKNYFYPDQSKNYQISQYDLPLSHDGYLEFEFNDEIQRVGITRAHVEEDTARNDHTRGTAESGVDFNRCGVSLLEIVTEPDLRFADQTYAFLTSLKQLLLYLGVSDCNMEEGSLRAEPNISVRPVGQEEFGTKTEVKNVASFSGVQKAIEYEFKRQVKLIRDGGKVNQETRGWDAAKGITVAQRSKESAHDYRYFPEPDLVPIVVDDAWRTEIGESLPELPLARKKRTVDQYDLNAYDAGVLTGTRAMADYFEAVAKAGAPTKIASNWITGDLQALVSDSKSDIADIKIKPEQLAQMIGLIEDGTISGKIAKEIVVDMFETGKDAKALVEEKGLVQISDASELEGLIREVMEKNPGPVEDFRGGKQQAKGFLVGQCMKATKGKGNPKVVNELLDKLLSEG
ncbi:MAG TPA: Asp-tRNA(Asn)/Glu-tRNA(Gln) amidotransferase subunit GatB [Candidatus Hydrogenedentes bacterium]|nr:Asp-tRNA(Asn)/Glu-tRNA(Gln) amidotransferase subunit GatB [Candidatus Hydrogenedentota bacterium]